MQEQQIQKADPFSLESLTTDQLYDWQQDLQQRDTSPFRTINKMIARELANRGLPEVDPALGLAF